MDVGPKHSHGGGTIRGCIGLVRLDWCCLLYYVKGIKGIDMSANGIGSCSLIRIVGVLNVSGIDFMSHHLLCLPRG